MNFVQFAESHGLIINNLVPYRWVRVPTVDHPKKRNGAYKFMQDHGFVQNHATQTSVSVWQEEGGCTRPDPAEMQRRAKEAQAQIARGQRDAAKRAEWILSQSELATHPYLKAKGFPDELGHVWEKDGARLLIVPMMVGPDLVGCQLIDESGDKRFLTGQRTKGAAFVIQNKGPVVLCEGYATGLSIRAALNAIRAKYTLFICFSANNLVHLASELPAGLVVADNDQSGTGERSAKETGWPYFMPPEVDQDFNDFHAATSLFRCSQALRSALLEGKQ